MIEIVPRETKWRDLVLDPCVESSSIDDTFNVLAESDVLRGSSFPVAPPIMGHQERPDPISWTWFFHL